MTQLAYLQTDSYNLLQIATFTTCCTTMTNSRLNPYKPLSEDNQEATFFFHQKTRLDAPTEIQGINDFPSNRTAAPVNLTDFQEPLEGINWNRLRDFERPPPASKRFRASTSHI
jgi:hypothetical protein